MLAFKFLNLAFYNASINVMNIVLVSFLYIVSSLSCLLTSFLLLPQIWLKLKKINKNSKIKKPAIS